MSQTPELLASISRFSDSYRQDSQFRYTIGLLERAREQIEKLLPDGKDVNVEPLPSPGRRSAVEAGATTKTRQSFPATSLQDQSRTLAGARTVVAIHLNTPPPKG